jgi:hypothetical protein
MPLIELLRIHSFQGRTTNGFVVNEGTNELSISDILPHSQIVPWESQEKIVVSSWILENGNYSPIEYLPANSISNVKGIDASMENTKNLVYLAKFGKSAIYSKGPNSVTEGIEYVATHFQVKRNGKNYSVPFLCSTKFRENTSNEAPEVVAKELHKLSESLGLKKGEYFVMVYCCHQISQCQNIPRGTIIVPYETLDKVMRVFGATCLLQKESESNRK